MFDLKKIVFKFNFIKYVLFRHIKILFRKNKKIRLLYINYDTKHLFDSSFIVINYRFANAIYYRFGNQITLEKQIKVFDLKKCDNELDFVVYGFFDKKEYKLKFEPKFTFENTCFRTAISNLNLKLEERIIPKLIRSNIYCDISTPKILTQKIKIKQPKIIISNTTFNQNEFI